MPLPRRKAPVGAAPPAEVEELTAAEEAGPVAEAVEEALLELPVPSPLST